MKRGRGPLRYDKGERLQSSFSFLELDKLYALPNREPSRSHSICGFRDLPKRYEETLARNRIQLTRKAFPLNKSKLNIYSREEMSETNRQQEDSQTGCLPFKSKHRHGHQMLFQNFGKKRIGQGKDPLQRKNDTEIHEKEICDISPNVVKLSLAEREPLKPKKKVGATPNRTRCDNKSRSSRKNDRKHLIFYEGSIVASYCNGKLTKHPSTCMTNRHQEQLENSHAFFFQ